MQSRVAYLLHGAIGGLLAGSIVAIWFLALDLLQGQAFATPALLAAAALGTVAVEVTIGTVLAYTILHFAAFALLGVAAAWILGSLGITPGLRHGVLFGLVILTGVHYGGLMIFGSWVLQELSFVNVVAANLVGGMAMTAYLHRATRAESPLGLGVMNHRLVVQGLVTGLLGAGAVALWFLLLDAMEGQAFFTPAALGSVLFLGAASPAEVAVNTGTVAAYTVLHVLAFWVAGVFFVAVSERVERTPGLWLIGLMTFIVLEGGFVAAVGALADWVIAYGWWAVASGNLIAVGVMGWWIWRTHAQLRERLTEEPVATMV